MIEDGKMKRFVLLLEDLSCWFTDDFSLRKNVLSLDQDQVEI